MLGVHFFFLALSLSLLIPLQSLASINALYGGSSLAVENQEDVLVSPCGFFSAGFASVGENAYCFGIWFSKPSCNTTSCTIVWMANRNFPVNGKNSELVLQENGNLFLTDAGQFTAWSTETTSNSPANLKLRDNGNLVLQNSEGDVLWQSFDHPTDTLLPEQQITRSTQLVSSRSKTNFSSGFYKLLFNSDNLLTLLYDGPEVSSSYWPYPWLKSWEAGRFSYNSSRFASFNTLGEFTSSDHFTFLATDYGVSLQRRLRLDTDGNLRLYSRDNKSVGWYVSWQARSQPCEIHGVCGSNSTCSYDPFSGRKCVCLPGYRVKNATDWSYGCEPEFEELSCEKNDTGTDFLRLNHVEFYGHDNGYFENYTLEMCKQECSQLCGGCIGFQYKLTGRTSQCYPKSVLINGRSSPNFEGDMYIKIPKGIQNVKKVTAGLDCSRDLIRPIDRVYQTKHENGMLKFMLWFASAAGVLEFLCILVVWLLMVSSQKNSSKEGYNLLSTTGTRRFSYAELRTATRNFSMELGRGAGGIVYKGTLPDARIAAIKLLNVTNQAEAEFLAEISTIGRLHHMNLIEMWGYCIEGNHRLLVYEYMEHGTLAANLASKSLDWRKRFNIALGTAKGLAYLHEECLEWVLHCDVKPQNILLDANCNPKVSDFGLSKLLDRDHISNSNFSKIRGTRGYMAPEWVFNMPITSKVDVYSYGIVVLEMVTGKSPAASGEEAENMRTVSWVREKRNEASETGSWVEEIVDPTMNEEYDVREIEILIDLALQCADENKDARPSMGKVVEELLRYERDPNTVKIQLEDILI